MTATVSFGILRNADFRRLLLIIATTTLGEFLLESVVYVWIVASTDEVGGLRPVLIGPYVLLSTLPRIVAAALLGVFADHAGARRSIVIANCGRGLAGMALGIGAVAASNSLTVSAAFLLLFVTACSTLNQLFLAARARYVQQIVAPALRPAAASTSMTVLTALSIGSAALGPFIFVKLGLVTCLALITALFTIGSVLSLRMRRPAPGDPAEPRVQRGAGFFRALLSGWAACWRIPSLRTVLLGAVFYGVPLGINNVALILLWVETKGATISQYGIASSLFGLGALFGSLAATRLTARWNMEPIYAVSLASLGLAYGALAFVPSLGASFILMGVAGALFSIFAVMQSPMLLNAAPPELTARVTSTTNSASAVSALASSLLVSAVFTLPRSGGLVVPAAVALGGLATIVGGALIAAKGPRAADVGQEPAGPAGR